MGKPRLVVIAGPTASGKSACAVALCKRVRGEIISADSMQLYRGMDIGTAKATPAERQGVPHHMLDVADTGEMWSAVMYRARALPIVREMISREILPVLCGGTGLYIDAVTKPMGFARPGNEEIRRKLTEIAEKAGGKAALHERLAVLDPATAARLSENDVRRVVRALEIIELSGRTITELNAEDAARETEFDVRMYAIDWPREVLYERIDRRVDEMMAAGLVGEVEALLRGGIDARSTAMQALGYKEIVRALKGEMTMPEAVTAIKQGTRNYAKRQLSWFRRDKRAVWLDARGKTADDLARVIQNDLRGANEEKSI